MDSLPVELVRLIFQFCDGPSVRTLRLGARRYALIGYEYLIPAHFTAVGWRDDVQRLHNIACHERLHSAVQTLTFNFSKLRENLSRVEYHTLSQNRLLLLDDFMDNVAWREHLSRDMAPFHTRRDTLEDALTRLSSLKALEITFTRSPHHVDELSDVFELFQCRTQDDVTAVENITTVISALRRTHLQTLTIDQLPLRTFSSPMGRRPWFESPAVFANLSRLDLVVYVPNDLGPNKLSRGICSLGDVLQLSTNLSDLRLGFRKQTHRGDEKFHVQFDALFRNSLTFNKLTDLKLECMSCTEWDLKRFLLRHASTLERLRLGGRGLALSREGQGGIHLSEGRWKSLFASLRGNLPKLQRLHLEGDFESGRFVASKEKWTFKPSTDDDWNELGDGDNQFRDYLRQGVRYNHDSRELERFVIAGGPWPVFQPAYTPGAVNFSSQSAGLASALATLLDQDNLGYQVAPMSSATTQNSGSAHHNSPLAPLSSSILSHRPHPSSTALGGQS